MLGFTAIRPARHWNIRALGDLTAKWLAGAKDSPKRDWHTVACLAEVISRFDVVAVQESRRNPLALKRLLASLGSSPSPPSCDTSTLAVMIAMPARNVPGSRGAGTRTSTMRAAARVRSDAATARTAPNGRARTDRRCRMTAPAASGIPVKGRPDLTMTAAKLVIAGRRLIETNTRASITQAVVELVAFWQAPAWPALTKVVFSHALSHSFRRPRFCHQSPSARLCFTG